MKHLHWNVFSTLESILQKTVRSPSLQKISNGYLVNPDEFVSYLFFNDERSFYGLLTEINEEHFILRADQLLSIFPESHPYVKFEGLTDEDDEQLQSIREAARCMEST